MTNARITRCPQCGASAKATADNPARPFCSRRCKLIDLGEWLNEERGIPGAPDGSDTVRYEEQID